MPENVDERRIERGMKLVADCIQATTTPIFQDYLERETEKIGESLQLASDANDRAGFDTWLIRLCDKAIEPLTAGFVSMGLRELRKCRSDFDWTAEAMEVGARKLARLHRDTTISEFVTDELDWKQLKEKLSTRLAVSEDGHTLPEAFACAFGAVVSVVCGVGCAINVSDPGPEGFRRRLNDQFHPNWPLVPVDQLAAEVVGSIVEK